MTAREDASAPGCGVQKSYGVNWRVRVPADRAALCAILSAPAREDANAPDCGVQKSYGANWRVRIPTDRAALCAILPAPAREDASAPSCGVQKRCGVTRILIELPTKGGGDHPLDG